MQFTVGGLAAKLGASCKGNENTVITGVSGLREAQPGDVSFLAQARYASSVSRTKASAIIVTRDFKSDYSGALIRVENPDAAFQQVAAWFASPRVSLPAEVHSSAEISADARVEEGVGIGPNVVVEAGARIAKGSRIWAGCYIGHGVQIGVHSVLYPRVTVLEYCVIGDRAVIHSGAVIGSDGFGFSVDENGVRTKIPQIGIVYIGSDVEIGANVTIDRARFGRTSIGDGVKIDNLVHIAHNVTIQDHAVVVAQVGISGSTLIESRAILGGQAGVAGHLVIGKGAIVGAQGGVTKDVRAGVYVTGYPATEHGKAAQTRAHVNRLPQLKSRIDKLEKRIRELEARPEQDN